MKILRISESAYAMMRKKELLKKLDNQDAKTAYAKYYEAVMQTADKLLRGTTFAYCHDINSKENSFIQFQIKTWNDCRPHLRNAALYEIMHYLTTEQSTVLNDADRILLDNLTCKFAELKRDHEQSPNMTEECAKANIKISSSEYKALANELKNNEKYYPAIEFVTRDYMRAQNYDKR